MEQFHTLQDFMLYSESMVYIIMGISIPVIIWFWFFLTGRDNEIRK